MSTSYFYLKRPFTSLRVEVAGGHTHVGVWVNHEKSGDLVFRNEEWPEARQAFVDYADDSDCPMRTHEGGKEMGVVVTENVRGLDPEMQVVSEYGEIMTVAEVRSRAGFKREDGMPAELFGYKESNG